MSRKTTSARTKEKPCNCYACGKEVVINENIHKSAYTQRTFCSYQCFQINYLKKKPENVVR